MLFGELPVVAFFGGVVWFHATMDALSHERFWTIIAQELSGNPSTLSCVAGNATATLIKDVLLPLAQWLGIAVIFEQPVLWCQAGTAISLL